LRYWRLIKTDEDSSARHGDGARLSATNLKRGRGALGWNRNLDGHAPHSTPRRVGHELIIARGEPHAEAPRAAGGDVSSGDGTIDFNQNDFDPRLEGP